MDIAYNAGSQTYTVTVGSRTQSFRSQDVDPTQSSAALTTYVRTSGNTADSFSLTTTGTAPGQTQYVGGAFWQRQVNGASTVEGYFDAATYGIRTAVGDVPLTGAASYDVRLLGLTSFSTLINALSGDGRVNVDFTTGAMNGNGWYRETDINSGFTGSDINWTLYASMGSNGNFSGVINIGSEANLTGGLFGPAAAEIGGTFYANPNSESATVGLLLGAQGTYPVNTATNLIAPEADTFYAPVSAGLKVAANSSGAIIGTEERENPVYAVLTPESGSIYTYSTLFSLAAQATLGRFDRQLYDANFEYMRVYDQIRTVSELDGSVYEIFSYGFETPGGDLPRTGTAAYRAYLRGGLAEPGEDDLQVVLGFGTMTADLGAGTLSTEGDYDIYDRPPAGFSLGGTPSEAPVDSGTWSGNGQISATEATFTGGLALDGANDYDGFWFGRFYGPTGEEFSSAANLSGSNGTISAAIFGDIDAGTSTALTPLANLPAGTLVSFVYEGVGYRYNPSLQRYYDDTLTPMLFGDPNYDATGTPPGFRIDGLYSTDNTQFSAAQSTDEVNVYTGQPTDLSADIDEFEVRDYVFDGQGGRVVLTYSGFAEIHGTGVVSTDGGTYNPSLYLAYGNITPADRAPTTGTASYTAARIGGSGEVWGDNGPEYYDLTGSSTLTANFASGEVDASLALEGVNIDTSAQIDFGTFAFEGATQITSAGQISGLGFLAQSIDDATGELRGLFFGPNAEEFGASFEIEATRDSRYFELYGSLVGTKD